MMHRSLPVKLRVLRAQQGLTLAEAAERIGIGRDTLSDLERGVRHPVLSTLAKIAEGYDVPVEDLLASEAEPALAGASPKAEAPTPGPSRSGEPSFNDVPGQQRRSEELKHLRAWRAFVWKIEHRWEEEPPQTSREIAVVLDTMQALIDEGAFEQPQDEVTASAGRTDSEGIELRALFLGLQRLNEIADDVERDEAAQRRRKVFELIEGQATA